MSEPLSDAAAYARDMIERSVLFWDVMRERGDRYRAHRSSETPSVLVFHAELLIDGEELDDPCNYYLMRVAPRDDVPCAAIARPVVIVDPRAGHGPGIAGFKADSEIVVALANDLSCYFVGFRPEPVPTQTIDSAPRRDSLSRARDRTSPGGGRLAIRDRQLSGGLGDDDGRRFAAGAGGAASRLENEASHEAMALEPAARAS